MKSHFRLQLGITRATWVWRTVERLSPLLFLGILGKALVLDFVNTSVMLALIAAGIVGLRIALMNDSPSHIKINRCTILIS